MAYTTFQHDTRYGPRPGLEGPFHYPSGTVLYYDPREGRYYDPRSDWYVANEEVDLLQRQILDQLRG